jgi:hypothetical protein
MQLAANVTPGNDVYGVFRCGLAHEYFVKKTARSLCYGREVGQELARIHVDTTGLSSKSIFRVSWFIGRSPPSIEQQSIHEDAP